MVKTNRMSILAISILLLIFLFLLDLTWGSIHIPFKEVFQILFAQSDDSINREILINFRLPKAITAILSGSALAVAGLMMQTLFRNPLADPYVMGVSSGASLGVAIVMLSSGLTIGLASSLPIVLAAVIGASVIMLLVVAVSLRVENVVSLLIVGIMFGTIVSSVVGVLQYYSNPDAIKLFVMWNLGSLSAVTWSNIYFLLPIIVVTLFLTFTLHRRLDSLLLGENYTKSLGFSIIQLRIVIVILTSILAGSITAFTGPIGFVGIAIPHIARGLLKTSKHQKLIPASIILGAILILVCDIVSQIPTYTLPINTISSLFGAPIIIWITLKSR